MQATPYHSGMRVEAQDVYEAREECPICSSRRPRRPCYRVQDHPTIEMLVCDGCGVRSASFMPTPELLDRYYARYYERNRQNITFGNPVRFARHLTKQMDGLSLSTSLRILDFGGGDGSLAVAVASNLHNQAGLEIPIEIDVVDYEQCRESGLRNVIIRRHRTLDEVAGPYDIVLASAILEHIPQARSAIEALIGAAGHGAFLYARTPYILPLARLVPKLDITYPAHVHDMGSTFWGKFIQTFSLRARLVSSRPSLVEIGFLESPLRATIAHAMKLPALAEMRLFGLQHSPLWRFVGGWEIMLRFD